jgi:hypothetical protein
MRLVIWVMFVIQYLGIVFNKWWISLFSILFITTFKSTGGDENE